MECGFNGALRLWFRCYLQCFRNRQGIRLKIGMGCYLKRRFLEIIQVWIWPETELSLRKMLGAFCKSILFSPGHELKSILWISIVLKFSSSMLLLFCIGRKINLGLPTWFGLCLPAGFFLQRNFRRGFLPLNDDWPEVIPFSSAWKTPNWNLEEILCTMEVFGGN